MAPLVYGRGTGYFKKASQQIPLMIGNTIKAGRSEYIAPGTATVGHVHVIDLARLFETVLSRSLIDPELPAGRNGFFFANTGRHTWAEVAEAIAKAGHALGKLKSDEAAGIDLPDAATKFWGGDERHTEYILASS